MTSELIPSQHILSKPAQTLSNNLILTALPKYHILNTDELCLFNLKD